MRRFVVPLSHCHLDHIAGTAAFADCEVIATTRTAQRLRANRRAIEAGALEGPPGIDPLVLPTPTFDERLHSTSAASASSCSTSTSTVTTPPSCGWRDVRVLQRCRSEPQLRSADVTELVADSLEAGWITYFAPYEAVHRENLASVTQHP